MWRAIKEALRMIGDVLSRTTSIFAYGVTGTAGWMIDIWNRWSRAMSGTNYRAPPVNDLRDHVASVTAEPEATAPDRGGQIELGRRVRIAAQAILDGALDAPPDLPGDVQLWLMARCNYALTLTVRASDEEVGAHMSGGPTLRGPSGFEVPVLDARRDQGIVKARIERSAPRVVSDYEKESIREMFETVHEAPLPDEDRALEDRPLQPRFVLAY